MPSKDVLADLLQGNPVDRLRGIANDRAIANKAFELAQRPDESTRPFKAVAPGPGGDGSEGDRPG